MYRFLPLIFLWKDDKTVDQLKNSAISIVNEIMTTAGQAAAGISEIGKGIASIFLLFVIFYYVSAILDGGKFQTKMLYPLLVYMAVCHFNLFSAPVISFVETLQNRTTQACSEVMAKERRAMGGEDKSIFAVMVDGAKNELNHIAEENKRQQENMAASLAFDILEDNPVSQGAESGGTSGESKNKSVVLSGMGDFARDAFKFASSYWLYEAIGSIQVGGVSLDDYGTIYVKWGFAGLIASLCQWICSAMFLMMIIFGGVLTALTLVFGPITFAFAVFPGNGRLIGTWAIRLCQYSLYSPLVYICQAFIYTAFSQIGEGNGGGSILFCFAVILANMACIFSVPGIAATIIEGASGSLSLATGLSTMTSSVRGAAQVVTSPFTTGWKGLQAIRNMGESRRDTQQMDILRSINDGVNGNPEYGLNPKKGGGAGKKGGGKKS